MKRSLILLILISNSIFSLFSGNKLVPDLKDRICEMSRNPFFQSQELHVLATDISNKGNTTDLSLRELYWNTFQDNAELENMIITQQPNGSWSDIDYKDSARSNWQPTNHVSRLLFLSRAYINPTSKSYHKPAVSEVLHRGINYWFREKPVCKNWWYNQVGIPRFFGLIFLFIENELTPQEKAGAIRVMDNSNFGMTGQNKVWLAGNVLMKALLTDDETLAKAARDTISSEIYISTKEGIQPDFSFHQHGPQQQFGNYGLAYISGMAYYANIFGGTSLAFSAKQISILRDYVFDGQNWIVWRGHMDVSACNRQLFKQAQMGKALTLCLAANQLKQADLPNEKSYDDLIQRNLYPGSLTEKAMSKHFWRSDLTVYRAAGQYISIRASSPRLIGTEFTNNENKKGHFISDGSTIILRRGDELEDIFPIWDWNRLPGVTAPLLDSIKPQPKTDNYRNPNPFVGGLTHNTAGISTFHLARNGVDAKKSWFYLNGIMVCLGTDIKTTVGKEIITGINQTLQRGEAFLTLENGESFSSNDTLFNSSAISTVWHDSTGYFFPKPMAASLSLRTQYGDWHAIADPYPTNTVSGKVFKLWINHGINAAISSAYTYFLIPGISQKELSIRVKNPIIEIIANCTAVQGVKLINNSLLQFVFHEPARISTFSELDYMETRTPGLVMFEQNTSKDFILTVVDPTHTQQVFKIILSGKYTWKQAVYNRNLNQTALVIALPQKGDAGRSVSIRLKRE